MTVSTSNRLASETSPYLRQHAHNPVDWYPWGAEAWERARREQRPVLLSVGYAACHWCHVMERESFSDPVTAAVMNAHFVCIKVDREERPDVDQLYQAAIGVLGVQGGWPLTVFLTPEQVPFFGGTYWPEAPRFGRQAFSEVLVRVAEAFRERRAQVESSAAELRAALEGMASLPGRTAERLDPSLVAASCEQLMTRWDGQHHGFGRQPRFPNTLLLELFLRQGLSAPDGAAWRERALASFGAMARGGIHDAIGGGFHRYSTDAAWAVPHFEKMLYDNALLLHLGAQLVRAAPGAARGQVAEVLRGIALWLSREMTDESGAFFASQDADSADGTGELEEGRFFVWRPTELAAALSEEDARLAALLLSVTERGNFDGGASVPARRLSLADAAAAEGLGEAEVARRWGAIRERLYEVRRARPRPAVDDKLLAAWNGLAIEGLAEAGVALDDAAMVAAAVRAMEAVERLLVTRVGLRRSWRGVPSPVPAFADDFAALACANLALLRATGRPHYLERARALAGTLLERFSDGEGGLYVTAHEAEALLERPRARYDEAVPSAVSLLARALLELAVTTGEGRWQDAAEQLLRRHATSMARSAFGHGGLLCAHDDAVRGLRLVVVTGPAADPSRESLLRTARAAVDPAVRVLPWTGEVDAGPLASVVHGKSGTAAWICDLSGCRPPIGDAALLAAALAG